ncbi:MAG: N-acetyl-gamma-glutamyl-phosphate reductase [Planctomycetes bacterium]|nr:N-acetyl-gamma-glutamyl-phosphate reductase [Planctomycetota bacterium]
MRGGVGEKVRVGVFGATGYIGGELLRYLAVHPAAEVRFATSRGDAGRPISKGYPNLRGLLDSPFVAPDGADVGGCDVVFCALPHNVSQEWIPRWIRENPDVRIIDMGGDFRTPDPAGYAEYYGREHGAPDLLSSFVYGFVEAKREAIRGARYVANPGCFATALLLALWPLRRAGLLAGSVQVAAVTGSTGSGNKPSGTTHHPERFTNYRAYKVLSHQHLLEVRHFIGAGGWDLDFVPHSGPFARGIFLTLFPPPIPLPRLAEVYREAYGGEALVDVIDGTPDLRLVLGTPRATIGVAGRAERGIVLAAIDNLGKGGPTQGIQNMNLMVGIEETCGLRIPGGFV